jgi:hypothetical protein
MDAGKRYYDRGKRETAPVIAEIDEREPGKHRQQSTREYGPFLINVIISKRTKAV